MLDHDQVLSIIAREGPVLPMKISKGIGTNLLFAAAVLSELVSHKKLRVSNIKIGSSPLYYKPGQESRLQNFAKHLNGKDKKAFDILKEQKVMRDSMQEPLMRACLRQIKDFAVPLEVTFNDQKEIFWKWYLLPNEEAELSIKNLLNLPSPEELEAKRIAEKERLEKEAEKQVKREEEKSKKEAAEKLRKVEEEKRKVEEEHKKAEAEKTKLEHQQRKVEEDKKRAAEEQQKIVEGQILEREKFKIEEGKRVLEARKQLNEERRKFEEEKKKLQKEQLLQKQKFEEELKNLQSQTVEREKAEEKKRQEEKDPFFKTMASFFSKHKIKVLESRIIKKKSEIEFMIEIESVLGNLDYYCVARNKKRVADSDINSVFVQSQLKKMPTMLLVTGDLTKKAKEMLGKEFKGLVVKKI